MIWKPCSGIGQLAVPSEAFSSRKSSKAMCPVCTKYLKVQVGMIVPDHDAVVIDSKPTEYQRESRR